MASKKQAQSKASETSARFYKKLTCVPLTAPYSNNFDSEIANMPPDCWTVVSGSVTVATNGSWQSPNSAPNSLSFQNSQSTPARIISPEFADLPNDNMRINFFGRWGNYAVVQIGTVSSPISSATINVIDTIVLQYSLNGLYQQFSIDITPANGYNGTDKYISISLIGPGNTNTYIDDFWYGKVPVCNPPKQADLGTSYITPNAALLKWKGGYPTNKRKVAWGGQTFTPSGTALGTAVITGAQDSLRITNLNSSTNYRYYVRDSCASGWQPWAGPFNFKTACLPLTAPYRESFNKAPWAATSYPPSTGSSSGTFHPCWSRTPDVPDEYIWNVFLGPGHFSTGPSGGNSPYSMGAYLGIRGSENILGFPDQVITSPYVYVGALTNPSVEFFYHRFAGIAIAPLLVEINNGTGWQQIYFVQGQTHAAAKDLYNYASINVSGYGDTIQLRFVAQLNGCCTGVIAIDDVAFIETPSCPFIEKLDATFATDSSAFLHWTGDSVGQDYIVYFGLKNFAIGRNPRPNEVKAIVNTNEAFVTSLLNNTCYHYFVRSYCGPGDTGYFRGPYELCTPTCKNKTMPYWEKFSGLTCWKVNKGNYPWQWINYSYLLAGASSQSDSVILRSPPIKISSKARLRFQWSHYNYPQSLKPDTLKVRVREFGKSNFDEILVLNGNAFIDPTAGQFNVGNFVETIVPIDSAKYFNKLIEIDFAYFVDGMNGYNLYLDNVIVERPFTRDVALRKVAFQKSSNCSNNPASLKVTVFNPTNTAINLASFPLTLVYSIIGPIQSFASQVFNSGSIPAKDSIVLNVSNINLSKSGYTRLAMRISYPVVVTNHFLTIH